MKEVFNEIQSKHRIRFYPKQKARFRALAESKFREIGYDNIVVDRHKNIIVGDIDNAKYVATAHYDTPPLSFYLTPFTRIFGQIAGMYIACAVIIAVLLGLQAILSTYANSLLGIIPPFVFLAMFFIPNPSNANDNTSGVLAVLSVAKKVFGSENASDYAFILFNNEELGLVGSNGFAADYKRAKGKAAEFEVFNLDCVAFGTSILLARKNECSACDKVMRVASKGELPVIKIKASFLTAASDNLKFENAVMITGVRKPLIGSFYLPKIHMPNDNKLDADFVDMMANLVVDATKGAAANDAVASDVVENVAVSDVIENDADADVAIDESDADADVAIDESDAVADVAIDENDAVAAEGTQDE